MKTDEKNYVINWEVKKIANQGKIDEHIFWVPYIEDFTIELYKSLKSLEKTGDVKNIVLSISLW